MIKTARIMLCAMLTLAWLANKAQVITDTLIPSSTLIENAIDLHNNGEYESAIATYAKVSPCDPNYTWACYEMALSYYYNNQNMAAIAKCNEAESLGYEDPHLFGLLGSIYDENGNSEKGVEILNKALVSWPYNQNLLYNLAVCYHKMDKPLEAESALIKSLRINPYHASSNMLLAKINLKLGRRAQAYLAYNMAIILNPGRKYITEYEEAITGHKDTLMKAWLYPDLSMNQPYQWDYLRYLCQSDLVSSSKIEYPYKVNYTITRQTYLLCSALKFEPADTSFYSQFYARFFTEMMAKNHFEAFSNYILKELGVEEIDQWIKANQELHNGFIDWAKECINLLRGTSFSFEREQKQIVYYHYNNDGDLAAIGTTIGQTNAERQGKFIYIGSVGQVTEIGHLINNKAEGDWLILNVDGSTQQILKFKNDQYEDTTKSFYPNKAVNGVYPMKDGKKNGVELHYMPSGVLKSKFTYVDNYLHGPAFFCNFLHGFSQEYVNVNNVTDGLLIETWLNGSSKSEIHYRNDMYDGSYKTWYLNGLPENDYQYRNNSFCGPYIEYYPNGNKKSKGAYDTLNHKTGISKLYYRNGQINVLDSVYVDGKLTGTSTEYYEDGKLRKKVEYNNDRIIDYTFYATDGKILYQSHEKDSSVYIISYYKNGVIKQEGWIRRGQRDGLWKTYNEIGILSDEENYANGYLSGWQKQYYANNAIKIRYQCDSNKIVGLYESFYNNGHLSQKGYYTKEGQAGEWLDYYANDSLKSKSFFEKGKTGGRTFIYYPDGTMNRIAVYNSDGDAIQSFVFENNTIDTLDFEWGQFTFTSKYPNGQKWKVIRVADRLLNGMQEEYYPNGQLMNQINYVYGSANGEYTTWDYNGNITFQCNYLMGNQNGSETWYEDGATTYTSEFELNKRQGIGTDFYKDGKIMRKMELVDNNRNGYTEYFAPDGLLMYRLQFIDNTLVAYSYLDKNGKYMNDIPITPVTKEIVAFYQNGKPSAKIPLKNGMYHGKFQSWYASGIKLRELDFVDDDVHGTEIKYYANGKIKETIENKFDSKNGLYNLYYENGKLNKEGRYYDGNEHGEWHIYGTDGKMKEILMYHHGNLYEIKKL